MTIRRHPAEAHLTPRRAPSAHGTTCGTPPSSRAARPERAAYTSKPLRSPPMRPSVARRNRSRCTPSPGRARERPRLSARASSSSHRCADRRICAPQALTQEGVPARPSPPPCSYPSALRSARAAARRGRETRAPRRSRSGCADRAPGWRNLPQAPAASKIKGRLAFASLSRCSETSARSRPT